MGLGDNCPYKTISAPSARTERAFPSPPKIKPSPSKLLHSCKPAAFVHFTGKLHYKSTWCIQTTLCLESETPVFYIAMIWCYAPHSDPAHAIFVRRTVKCYI